jgi:hypothetical protein
VDDFLIGTDLVGIEMFVTPYQEATATSYRPIVLLDPFKIDRRCQPLAWCSASAMKKRRKERMRVACIMKRQDPNLVTWNGAGF